MKVLSGESVAAIRKEIAGFPSSRSALLPALHIAQNQLGRITPEAMEDVSELFELPYSDVEEVVTFYTMFYEDNVGSYVLEVCKTVPCGIMGADEIITHMASRLGIEPGQTTPDGLFTLLRVECLAGCDKAPVMQINSRYYENLTTEKVDRLLQAMKSLGRARGGLQREARLTDVEAVGQA